MTLYCARFASLNRVASSVVSTVKLFVVASCWIVWMPFVIDAWRNPAVAEKISALNPAARTGTAKPRQKNTAHAQTLNLQAKLEERAARNLRIIRSREVAFTLASYITRP